MDGEVLSVPPFLSLSLSSAAATPKDISPKGDSSSSSSSLSQKQQGHISDEEPWYVIYVPHFHIQGWTKLERQMEGLIIWRVSYDK